MQIRCTGMVPSSTTRTTGHTTHKRVAPCRVIASRDENKVRGEFPCDGHEYMLPYREVLCVPHTALIPADVNAEPSAVVGADGAWCAIWGTRVKVALIVSAGRGFIRREARCRCRRGTRCAVTRAVGVYDSFDSPESIFVPVNTKVEHIWIIQKHSLRSVAVMYVPINNQDSLLPPNVLEDARGITRAREDQPSKCAVQRQCWSTNTEEGYAAQKGGTRTCCRPVLTTAWRAATATLLNRQNPIAVEAPEPWGSTADQVFRPRRQHTSNSRTDNGSENIVVLPVCASAWCPGGLLSKGEW